MKQVQKIWHVNDSELLQYNNVLFVLNDIAIKAELLQHYYNNFITEHFEVEKIYDFLKKKFF